MKVEGIFGKLNSSSKRDYQGVVGDLNTGGQQNWHISPTETFVFLKLNSYCFAICCCILLYEYLNLNSISLSSAD
jgi:hypothetical protein